jgi:hypothetical protein
MAVLCHIMYIPLVPIPHARQGLQFSLRIALEVYVHIDTILPHEALRVQFPSAGRCMDGNASGRANRRVATLVRKMIVVGGLTEYSMVVPECILLRFTFQSFLS